jgi:GNAT superfamily N-acetyltransferase
MTVQQPTVRAAQPHDLSILSEYWYDRMALMAHKRTSARLRPDARATWEQDARIWLQDSRTRAVVMIQGDEVVGGLFARIGTNTADEPSEQCAIILAFVIDLHTTHQRHGVGRVLWQALRAQLQADGITRLYAPTQAGDMLENTFWPSVGAWPAEQWFGLDI